MNYVYDVDAETMDEQRAYRQRRRFDCLDGLCGALDCEKCNPSLLALESEAEREDEAAARGTHGAP